MSKPRIARKQLVVNRPLQSRFVVTLSWPIVACITTTMVSLFWFTGRIADQAYETGVAIDGLASLLVTVIAFVAASIIYLVWHFFRVSNRVVGPMDRMERALDRFRAGERDVRIELRKGDFLLETADHLDDFLVWVAANLPAGTSTSSATPQSAVDEREEAKSRAAVNSTVKTVDAE
jgi:hypothetical protein